MIRRASGGLAPADGMVQDWSVGDCSRSARPKNATCRRLMVRLALVEDDTDLRAALTGMLARAGYAPEVFESAEDFLGSDSVSTFDLVVSEFPMEGSEGAEILKACRAVPDPPAILLVTGRGSVVEALEAARAGAIDYVGKPVDARELAARVGCSLELRRLRRERRGLWRGDRPRPTRWPPREGRTRP